MAEVADEIVGYKSGAFVDYALRCIPSIDDNEGLGSLRALGDLFIGNDSIGEQLVSSNFLDIVKPYITHQSSGF